MARTKHTPYLDSEDEGLSPATSHPDYVAAAPEWFWSEDDPRAPFGSDEGYDTLNTLHDHFRDGGGDEHVPGCIANMISEWDFVPEHLWSSSQEDIVAWLNADSYNAQLIHGEIRAYIAAACGQFKTSGWIHPALRFWAERAMMLLEHVLAPWDRETHGADTSRLPDRLTAIRKVVETAPEPPAEMQLPMYSGR